MSQLPPAAAAARSPVPAVLLVLAGAAAWGLGLVGVAPNRLLSGRPVPLAQVLGQADPAVGWMLAGALLAWVLAAMRPLTPRRGVVVVLAAGLAVAALALAAGGEAQRRMAQALLAAPADSAPTLRVSLGGAFWCLAGLAWLGAADTLQRLGWTASRRAWGHAALWLPLAAVLAGGRLDALSLMQEWAQRQDVWAAACWRHLQIVATALLPALLLGLPLGVLVARRPRRGQRLLALLGQVQTMPSIALFGLLIAPLAALGALWPGSGIQGVGLWPAVLALVAYALLPIVAGVAAGLQQVEPAVVEAARGMGLTRGQRLRQVELPLALPALWSALRLAAVQGVGLAVVAALIGAGGLGTLVFQGLAAGALDLVLLGVLPVVAMALVLDAALGAWAASSRIGRVAPLPPPGRPA